MTARKAGRVWAEGLWAIGAPEVRACTWEDVAGPRRDVVGAEWDAARERWNELQAAERGEEG